MFYGIDLVIWLGIDHWYPLMLPLHWDCECTKYPNQNLWWFSNICGELVWITKQSQQSYESSTNYKNSYLIWEFVPVLCCVVAVSWMFCGVSHNFLFAPNCHEWTKLWMNGLQSCYRAYKMSMKGVWCNRNPWNLGPNMLTIKKFGPDFMNCP